MQHGKQQGKEGRLGARGFPLARMAVVTLALGAMSASAFATGTAGAASRLVISTAKNSQFGTILVSHSPLYTLKPSSTPCNASCQTIWPEVLLPKGAKKATAGTGVNASKLGTIKRAHGALQVTYGGKPLYWFSGDSAGSQVNGNITDTWGAWSVSVTKASTSTSGTGTGGSTAGGGGAAF